MPNIKSLRPLTTMLILLLAFAAGCARNPRTIDIADIPLYDLSLDAAAAEKLAQLQDGQPLGDHIVIKIPAGYKLPVHVKIDTPVAAMDSDAGTLQFARDLYLHISNEEILVGPDGKRWTQFSDTKAVKELFGAEQGMVKLEMNANKEEGALLLFEVSMTKAP